ncbi:MAG: O-methyltransferase [Opitutales bacterium]
MPAFAPALRALLAELAESGRRHDAAQADRAQMMLNIAPEVGEFLLLTARALGARRILELGTSNGYSTIWLAEAVRPAEGRVLTIERLPRKRELAAANFARAGLAAFIEQQAGEAGPLLAAFTDGEFDLVFLDAKRDEYPVWWPDLRRLVRPGGMLVADNALSHPAELAPFRALVEADPDWHTAVLPLGKGEFTALRAAGRPPVS